VRGRPKTLVAIGLAVALAVALPLLSSAYIVFLANLMMMYAVLALGLDILLGRAGQFAFAHTAFFGIGIYTAALVTNGTGLPFFVSIPAGALAAGVVGIVIALPSTRLKHLYLGLATFAFAEVAQWTFNNLEAVTGGANGLRFRPSNFVFGEITNDMEAYPFVALIALLMIWLTRNLGRSKLGRSMEAIKESEAAALASGISVNRTKAIAFTISAVYAGTAGGMFTLFQSYVHPDVLGFDTLVLVLSMVVIGGLGTLPGVLIGVLVLSVLPEVMRDLEVMQELFYGIILMLFLMFMPSGIWGRIASWQEARRQTAASQPLVRAGEAGHD
jgi:branched-chain amino acid transport system permease protein